MNRYMRQRVLAYGAIVTAIAGCGKDATGPAQLTSAQAYWALQINYSAVNMATIAPANQVKLIATPLDPDGQPIAGLPPATFRSTDSTVTVDSAGLLTAHFATQGLPTPVVVSLTGQKVTLVDTVWIQVTDTIPQHPLATFSMRPAAGDSAKRALPDLNSSMRYTFLWTVMAIDAAGNTVCSSGQCALQVNYTSSNPHLASINYATGMVTPHDTGHVVFTASSWVYGVAKRDSVSFVIGYKLSYLMQIGFSQQPGPRTVEFGAPKRVVLGVNAVVGFVCAANADPYPACDRPVDVVFDHPASIDTGTIRYFGTFDVAPNGRGNIPAFGGDSLLSADGLATAVRTRRFPVAGIYRYHSGLFPSDVYEIEIKP